MKKSTFRDSKGNLKNEYNEVNARSNTLDELGAEIDSLLVRMQSAKSKRAMDRAFRSSPAQLGSTAIKATRKRR